MTNETKPAPATAAQQERRTNIAAAIYARMATFGGIWPDYRDAQELARRSVHHADALIAELDKDQP